MSSLMVNLLALVCAAAQWLFPSQAARPDQSSTVSKSESSVDMPICELFRKLDAFDNKQVAVRGVYRFSSELSGLYSEGCPEPLILDGVERPQALDADFVGKGAEQRAEFEEFGRIVDRIAKGGGRQAIHVTLIGTLIARNPKLHRLGNRTGERMFGHLGVYPARLDYTAIRSITIEDEAIRPSNMDLRR
jgi:hypothetical protein